MHSNHTSHRIFLFLLLTLLIVANQTGAVARADKRKTRSVAQQTKSSLSRTELKKAAQRLSEMGYANGNDGGIDRSAIIAFQKWEGLDVTGRITRADYEAIMNANAPQPKDAGYKHVEVDLDRQVLLLIDDNGEVEKILPVSTGSEQRYNVKGMSGLAYTPRGRFRISSKLSGWKRSPLGLLYYPNYFSDGLAIHGNPSVPDNPQSHGCIRIPMSSAAEMSDLLPVGTIVLIYDQRSFVSAKDWAQADREKQQAANR